MATTERELSIRFLLLAMPFFISHWPAAQAKRSFDMASSRRSAQWDELEAGTIETPAIVDMATIDRRLRNLSLEELMALNEKTRQILAKSKAKGFLSYDNL